MSTVQESVKSRSSTPQKEYVKAGVTDTLQLLEKWNLLELQSIFKEHDITFRSLIYLTDEEICELLPKIGVRTIFRAMLKEWRQTYDAIAYPKTLNPCDVQFDSYLDQIELKTESNSINFDVNTCATDQYDFPSECLKQHIEKEQNCYRRNNEEYDLPEVDNTSTGKPKKQLKFIVLDILITSSDGRAVLEFYKLHNFLDMKNRKRVVNLLVRSVVERKVEKYTAIFHDMTRQLLQIFPTEKYETYFVPHSGQNSARGALYYRYSNYTRQLRKEGLLAYKKNKVQRFNI